MSLGRTSGEMSVISHTDLHLNSVWDGKDMFKRSLDVCADYQFFLMPCEPVFSYNCPRFSFLLFRENSGACYNEWTISVLYEAYAKMKPLLCLCYFKKLSVCEGNNVVTMEWRDFTYHFLTIFAESTNWGFSFPSSLISIWQACDSCCPESTATPREHLFL